MKPATAPKIEPRSSAIDSSATSTTLAVRNSRYSVRTDSWSSAATNRTSAAFRPSISRSSSARGRRRTGSTRSRRAASPGCSGTGSRRRSTGSRRCRSGCRAGTSTCSGPAPSVPAVTIVSPTRTYGCFGTRSRIRTSLEPAAAANGADHPRVRQVGRGDGALAVGEQRHARHVRVTLVDRADERAAAVRPADRLDDDAAHDDAVGRAGGDDDALVERALRVREHRGVDLRRSRRPTAGRCSSSAFCSSTFCWIAPSSRISCAAKRLVLRAQLLVLVLRVDEAAEPADRVGERARDPVGGDLERPQDRRARPLDAVERGRAERDGDQDERGQHEETPRRSGA